VLRTREENGACVFLNERGCGVHPDRPLACRLYPLARWVDPDGYESFGLLTPHPQTEGVYGVGGTVEDYLRGQGVAPFFTIGDTYGEVYARMLAVLERLDTSELDSRPERRAAISEMAAGSLGSPFLDVDATVDAYCAQHNSEKPTDVDKLVELHIEAVLEWLQTLNDAKLGRERHEQPTGSR
jgi:Fe-S-cluster containining protein